MPRQQGDSLGSPRAGRARLALADVDVRHFLQEPGGPATRCAPELVRKLGANLRPDVYEEALGFLFEVAAKAD